MKTAYLLAGAAALALSSPALAGDTIKIGFVSTFSGPTAVIGNDMRNSFELALDHLGRKMGGKPVEVIYEDDGQKPDVGKQKTEKLVQSRQGRLHRRLHLVERAAGLAEDRGRLADLPDLAPMPVRTSSPASCARLTCSRPRGRTTRRRRRWAST